MLAEPGAHNFYHLRPNVVDEGRLGKRSVGGPRPDRLESREALDTKWDRNEDRAGWNLEIIAGSLCPTVDVQRLKKISVHISLM